MPSKLSTLLFVQEKAQIKLETTLEWNELHKIKNQIRELIESCKHEFDNGDSSYIEVNRIGYDVIYECQLCGRTIEK